MKKNQPEKREKRRPGRKPGVKVKHGAYSLIARGELPQKRRYLERWLTEVREGLIHDLGPKEENLSTAQRLLVNIIISKVGILRCVEEHVKEAGVIKGQELSPILKRNYLGWANSLRLDLQALGIDRKAVEPEVSLAQIVREIDAENEAKRAAEKAGQGKDSGEGEKGEPETNGEEISGKEECRG